MSKNSSICCECNDERVNFPALYRGVTLNLTIRRNYALYTNIKERHNLYLKFVLLWHLAVYIWIVIVCWYKVVGLPEWSKGSRSGRDVFVRVGSNPTADIFAPNCTQARDSREPLKHYISILASVGTSNPLRASWNIFTRDHIYIYIYIYAYLTSFNAWMRHSISDSSGFCSIKCSLTTFIRCTQSKSLFILYIFLR